MGKADKFAWINAVAGDRRLTEGERFVLTNIAVRYVLYGADGFRVRQATVTKHLAVGERLVRKSISRGRQLGYLVLAQERQRGRSHHGPDEHRLVIPADRAAISDEIPADGAAITAEIPARSDQNTGTESRKYRHGPTR